MKEERKGNYNSKQQNEKSNMQTTQNRFPRVPPFVEGRAGQSSTELNNVCICFRLWREKRILESKIFQKIITGIPVVAQS